MTDLEKHVNQPGRDKLVKKVREKINELGITYIYYQFISVTGRVVGKGIPADHWERTAEKGFQLVYGSTANLFVDRHKISTIEKPYWTDLYHAKDPNKKAFGGKVIITMNDGKIIEDKIERANAHPAGKRPFKRENYIGKFDILTKELITKKERNRFIELVENLRNLSAEQVKEINVQVAELSNSTLDTKGIF